MTTSYNGWPLISKDGQADYSSPFLAHVTVAGGWTLLTRTGDVATLFKRFIAEYASLVEPLTGQPWSYAYRRNVNHPEVWSCHASATAIDLNADWHPNGTDASQTFTAVQVSAMRALVSRYTPLRWLEHYDPMHVEIFCSATELHAWLTNTPAPNVYPTLRIGSTGVWVTAWQRYLVLNYRWARGLVIDGKYGPQTANMTSIFQSHTGLGVDGVAGPITLTYASHYASPFTLTGYSR